MVSPDKELFLSFFFFFFFYRFQAAVSSLTAWRMEFQSNSDILILGRLDREKK